MEKYLRWGLSVGLFLFGLLTYDTGSWKWGIAGFVIYSLPLALQCTSWQTLRFYSLWISLFVALQAVYSYHFPDLYHALPPNLNVTIDTGRPEIGVIKVTTDAKGYRTTKPVQYDQKSGLRVFTIGASTTLEEYLSEKGTWSHLLQEELSRSVSPDAEVINAGVSGTRSGNHLATLKKISQYHPSLVVFLLGAPDWIAHITSELSPNDPTSNFADRRTDHYALKYSLLAGLTGVFLKPKTNAIAAQTGGATEEEGIAPSLRAERPFAPTAISKPYAANLTKMSEFCKKLQLTCIFANQPTAYQAGVSDALKKKFWMTPPFAKYKLDMPSLISLARLYNEELIRFAKQQGHIACDLASAIPPTPEFFYDEAHLTPKAQSRVAQSIAGCLKEQGNSRTL